MSTKTTTDTLTAEHDSPAGTFCGGQKMPEPGKEHQWLQRFVGDWESEVEMTMGPGQPNKTQGKSRVRMLGGFWMIEEGQSTSMPFSFILTLGYDPQKKKYVGSWVDTMMGYLWRYEGSVDASGNILTLHTEGPSPTAPGKVAKFRDVTVFKTNDHREYTSSILGDDGKYTTFLTVNSRRKK